MKYKAILFSPDGAFVTDFRRDSKQEIWEEISEMGSRWIFYPISFIATEKTIVDTPDGLDHLTGKRIKTVQKHIKNQWEENEEEVLEVINNGYPLNLIY